AAARAARALRVAHPPLRPWHRCAAARERGVDGPRGARDHAEHRVRSVRGRLLPADGRAAGGHRTLDAARADAAAAPAARLEPREYEHAALGADGGLARRVAEPAA